MVTYDSANGCACLLLLRSDEEGAGAFAAEL